MGRSPEMDNDPNIVGIYLNGILFLLTTLVGP